MSGVKILRGGWYDQQAGLEEVLVGRSVVEADSKAGTLVLDNGVVLEFDKDNSDCCSYFTLQHLHAVNNVITKVLLDDTDTGCGPYEASISVVTSAGVELLAEGEGDASNGYYLHGFALDVRVRRQGEES